MHHRVPAETTLASQRTDCHRCVCTSFRQGQDQTKVAFAAPVLEPGYQTRLAAQVPGLADLVYSLHKTLGLCWDHPRVCPLLESVEDDSVLLELQDWLR